MSKYFQVYEATRKKYSVIQPGSLWKHKVVPDLTFRVNVINLKNKVAYGDILLLNDFKSVYLNFDFLLDFYTPSEQTHEVK